jgi:hypothetical protein
MLICWTLYSKRLADKSDTAKALGPVTVTKAGILRSLPYIASTAFARILGDER